ncbi:hypothetical protein AFK68_24730 [Hydrocoleum sp. CS-953]|nr:hypothetical protein AFK68_24730 [Hydrocoleum sp. CS-953]
MRIILDTNTLISGLFWRGKPFEVTAENMLGLSPVFKCQNYQYYTCTNYINQQNYENKYPNNTR